PLLPVAEGWWRGQRRGIDRARTDGGRAGALDLVSARGAPGDGGDVVGGGGAGGVGDAGRGGERSRHRGGGRRRRGRAVDGVGADRRPAGQPHSPPGGAAPAGDN